MISFFRSLYKFLSELNNIFHVKGEKRFFFCQINLTIGERPNKKDIESLHLTRINIKVNILRL